MTNAAYPSLPELTTEQRAICRDVDHHLMVESGAGSGKTTLVIAKILHETGVEPVSDRPPAEPLAIDEIGAITFTRKAAGELKERLRGHLLRRAEAATGRLREHWAEVAQGVDDAHIGTIDAFAGQLIRDHGGMVGMETGFEILDPGDASALQREVAEAAILDGLERGDAGVPFLVRQYGFSRARDFVARCFDQADLLREILEARELGRIDWDRYRFDRTETDVLLEPRSRELLAFLERAHEKLVARMDTEGVLDHSHVVLRAAELAAHPEVRYAFQSKVGLLFVDEHQDTSRAQLKLLFRLADLGDLEAGEVEECGGDARTALRLVLVGDPKQGIYGFRNADITLWSKSREALEAVGGRYETLRTNHRSRPTLLRFFDRTMGAILNEHDDENGGGPAAVSRYEVPYRTLRPGRPETVGDGVEVLLARERGSENVAEVVADRIDYVLRHAEDFPVFERGSDGEEVARPVRPRDIAILSRSLKHSADDYERALRDRGIRSYVYGGRGLYGRREIQDLAILLRAVADPHDPFTLTAYLRSPLGGLSDRALTRLSRAVESEADAEGDGSLYDVLARPETLLRHGEDVRQAAEARARLERLRKMRDRKPHHELLEHAVAESGYRAFLAGAPDRPAGIRNVDKLIRIAQRAAHEPLSEFVRQLEARVRRADPEEEAPLYSPDDDLVVISTIHKAKGLEWPYVFVTGMDEKLFLDIGFRGDRPRLSPDLGVVMSLDVVGADATADAPEVAGSEAWKQFYHDATRREYGEAKRLFYVACTRARDRLFLAGALTKDSRPRSLSWSLDYLKYQRGDHWLRHIYPSLVAEGDRGRDFLYGPGALGTRRDGGGARQKDVATIRRGRVQMTEGLDTAVTSTAPDDAPPREWPRAFPLDELDGAPAASMPSSVTRRAGPPEHDSPIRIELTASEILKFTSCPWKHFFGYRKGLSSPSLEVQSEDARINLVLPKKRGDILHDYLLEHREHWSEDERLAEMERALLRHLPMAEDAATENAREILGHARNYFESEWYARAQNALESHREIPFTLQLDERTRVTGQIDFLFRESDGWRIIDFKAGLFRGVRDLYRAIDRRAREYEVQAALYTIAARHALGLDNVREFAFFFTAPAVAKTFEVTDRWPSKLAPFIERSIARIRGAGYGEVPIYGEQKCHGCEYIRLCHPEGVPDEVLERARETSRSLPVVDGEGGTSSSDRPAA